MQLFFLFFSFFFSPVDEMQPIFLTYLKALNLLSVTVFDYLPQQSTVMWKSPAVFLGPQTDQGKPNIRRDLLPSLLCIGYQSAIVLRANPNMCVPVAPQTRKKSSLSGSPAPKNKETGLGPQKIWPYQTQISYGIGNIL